MFHLPNYQSTLAFWVNSPTTMFKIKPRNIIAGFLFFLLPAILISQPDQTNQLNGSVIDYDTSRPISGVTILVIGTNIGTSTDQNGNFVFPLLSAGNFTLEFRSIGYRTISLSVNVPEDTRQPLEIILRPSVINFNEIVITSSPTGSGVRYQPDRAFSGEELNRRRDITIGQMLDGEPGVSMSSFGPAPARPVIRGLDGERILILENGERMGDISESAADHAIALDPQAAERLEVIRGPASLLYGTSALGGVINLLTSDIPKDWSPGSFGGLSFSGASVNNMGSGFGRIGHGWENKAVSARMSYRSAGNMQTPEGMLDGTDLSTVEGSAGYGFRNSTAQGGISFMGMKSAYGIPEALDDPDLKVEIRFNRIASQGRLDFERNSFFDKFQIKYHVARFHQSEMEIERNDDGTVDEIVGVSYDQDAFSTTLNMQHTPFGIFDRGVVGLNVNGRIMDVGGEEAYTPGDQYINTALFTFQEIPISSLVRLQAGVRLDYRNITTRTNHANPDIDETKNDFNVAASLGLNYRPDPAVELGFQLARAHRYPTSEELFANGVHLGQGTFEIGDPTLETEIGYGADMFFRYQQGRIQMEVAGFLTYIQNFVTFQPTGQIDVSSGFPIFLYGAENARLFGGEFSLATSMTDDLVVTLGADVVHGTSLGDQDTPLPFMPPVRFRLGTEYTIGPAWTGFTIRHVTTQNRVAPEEDTTDGYTLFNIQAGYRFDKSGLHRLVLRAENLFNLTYRDHLSRVEDREFPMPGRNITLIYSWNF